MGYSPWGHTELDMTEVTAATAVYKLRVDPHPLFFLCVCFASPMTCGEDYFVQSPICISLIV